MKLRLKSIFTFILSAFLWALIALDTFLLFLATALMRPLDPNQRLAHHAANLWGKVIVRSNPFWKVTITGAYHIKKNKGYVLIANHASLADIVCLHCLGKHFKWVAKSSLFRIPILGWTMSLLNYIPLKRGKHGSIRDSFQEAQEWLEKDISVLIFAEGTRSQTGELGVFKNGAFKLALKTGKPIIPIVIRGTSEAISKGEASMMAKVSGLIKVFPEIDVHSYGPDDYDKLKTHVWNLMNEELTKSA